MWKAGGTRSPTDDQIRVFVLKRPWINQARLSNMIGLSRINFAGFLYGRKPVPKAKRVVLVKYLVSVGFGRYPVGRKYEFY